MLRDDSRILAIEPDTYQDWLAQMRESVPYGPSLLEGLRGPEAAARLRPARKGVGAIAVFRLGGFITQKPTILSELFGGTSTEALVAELREAIAEPSVGAVVLDVDSPGGSVFGVPEAAAAIRELRGKKPMIAVANPLMASAAYYLAAQFDEIVATPSSLTGSIGTMSVFVDETKAFEKMGLRVEVFTHGERKAEESGLQPLTDQARDAIQARVDYYGAMFDADVAEGRGVSRRLVQGSFGRGAVFNAEDAVRRNLVDRVGTLDDELGRLVRGEKPRRRSLAAAEDPVEVTARRALAGLTSPEGAGVE